MNVIYTLICSLCLLSSQMLVGQNLDSLKPLDLNLTVVNFLEQEEQSGYAYHNALPNWLQSNGINVKSYGGPGALASAGVRGTSADHTQVMWEGFNLNSISLGSFDLSSIPVFALSEANINEHNTPTEWGSGTFGSVVDIATNSINDSKEYIHLQLNTSSIGAFQSNAKYQFEQRRWQLSGSVLNDLSKNNFSYLDPYKFGTPRDTAINNGLKSTTIVQHINYTLSNKASLQSGMWWQNRTKELPAQLGENGRSYAKQEDGYKRIYLKSKFQTGRLVWKLKSGVFSDQIHFTDKEIEEGPLFIDSETRTFHWQNGLSTQFNNSSLSWKIGANANRLSAATRNYPSSPKEWRKAVYASISKPFRSHKLSLSIRADKVPTSPVVFTGKAGTVFSMLQNNWHHTLSISRKNRFPDFNELYWQPGGNLELLPENGWVSSWHHLFTISSHWKLKLVFMDTDIKNWITWQPINGTWTPVNVHHFNSKDIKIAINGTKHLNDLAMVRFKAGASFTDARNMRLDGVQRSKQPLTPYTPIWTVNSALTADFSRHWRIHFNGQWVGERFTNVENTALFALPAYGILNAQLGKKFKLANAHEVNLSLSIQNVTNTFYEVVRTYAVPGRVWGLSINYNLTNPKTDL